MTLYPKNFLEISNIENINSLLSFNNRIPGYYEEYKRIDLACYRETNTRLEQVRRNALINGFPELLPQLAIAYRDLMMASKTSATIRESGH